MFVYLFFTAIFVERIMTHLKINVFIFAMIQFHIQQYSVGMPTEFVYTFSHLKRPFLQVMK